MADRITTLRIGVPGAPGAGVSAAEKASFVTLAGANVFTNTNEVRASNTGALIVGSGAAQSTRSLVVDSVNKEIKLWNQADLRGFSDVGVTELWSIDGATGNIQTDGILTVDGSQIKGEQLWLSFMVDGGGSVLTTGVKARVLLPYNMQPISDGSVAWQSGLDQVGSIGWDLWMDSYTNYPPTNADRVSGTIGSQNPRITSAIKGASASLTGWNTTWMKGNWLFVAIDTVATATWATLGVHIKKT
jgi:hypothetical protein